MTTVSDALDWASTRLEHAADSDPRLEAMILLGHVLKRDRSWLYAWPEKDISSSDAAAFRALVEQRHNGTPVAYLLGSREFWSLEFEVSSDTLIPRPETELLVTLVLELAKNDTPLRILDLGTGSGAVAISIASERPGWSIVATDRSPAALVIARRNAQRQQLRNVSLLAGDWYQALAAEERFDVIVSNPPYVADGDPHLSQGDLRFEPAIALSSGPQGLDDLGKIISQAPVFLSSGGHLMVEHGADQGLAVSGLFHNAGLGEIGTRHDLAGLDRVTLGRKPN